MTYERDRHGRASCVVKPATAPWEVEFFCVVPRRALGSWGSQRRGGGACPRPRKGDPIPLRSMLALGRLMTYERDHQRTGVPCCHDGTAPWDVKFFERRAPR